MMTIEAAIRQLPKLEQTFVIMSQLTRKPYVVCSSETYDDEAFLYTEEAAAIEEAKRLVDDNRPSKAMKVLKSELLQLLGDLAVYGVNAIVLHYGSEVFHIQLNRLIRRQDLSKLPEGQRPVENPALQLSMIYFFQEIRRKRENREVSEFKDLEEEMLANLVRGKYLIPLKETESDGKKNMQMIFIKMVNGTQMMPVFTDAGEFARFRGKEEFRLAVMDFEKLAAVPFPEDCKGIVLNPAGVSVPMLKEHMQRFLKEFA